MNLYNIKEIFIPEGIVKKINDANSKIWEKQSLVCNPKFALTYFELASYLPFEIDVINLSQSLLQSLNISFQEYDNETEDYTIILSNIENVPVHSVIYSNGLSFVGTFDELNVLPNMNTRNCRILIELVYTDLDGHTQTLSKIVPYDASLLE